MLRPEVESRTTRKLKYSCNGVLCVARQLSSPRLPGGTVSQLLMAACTEYMATLFLYSYCKVGESEIKRRRRNEMLCQNKWNR